MTGPRATPARRRHGRERRPGWGWGWGRTFALLLAAAGMLALAGGCAAPRASFDPAASRIGYDDLRRPETPQRLLLSTTFQRNGRAFPAGDADLRGVTETVLRKSGIIEPVLTGSEGEISVILDNVSSDDALGRNAITNRPGLAGGARADHYVMNVTIRTGLAGEARPGERPGYFSSTSSAEAATGADLRSSNRGFGRTVEQMLLGILREYQNRGEEAHRPR